MKIRLLFQSVPSVGSLLSDRASLGVSTITFQLAMLIFIALLKLGVSDAEFSSFLAVIGIAAIVGATASLRSEVLIMQTDRMVGLRTLVWPVMIIVATTLLFWVLRGAIAGLFDVAVPQYGVVVALAMAVQILGQFVLIQQGHFVRLMIIRAMQAVLLLLAGAAALAGMPFGQLVWAFSGALLTPFAFWMILWIFRNRSREMGPYRFSPVQVRRSGVLSLTLLVNTAAVNLPIILCVATQSASYAADFGFLMKVFVAPVTLANAMFGQLFLADNIKRDTTDPEEALAVRKSMRGTSLRAILFYTSLAVPAIAVVYAISHFLPDLVSRPELSFAIILATLAQAAFSPVSQIGDIAKIENSFILLYIVRVLLLYVLLGAAWSLDYTMVFAIVSLLMYAVFWVYADFRLRGMTRLSA